jgi:glucose/arabinose dehydrogenase
MMQRLGLFIALVALAGCGGGGSGSSSPPAGTPTSAPTIAPTVAPSASPSPSASATPLATLPLSLNVNNLTGQFYGEIVATFSHISPRELVMLPNGDLLVGTGGGTANFAQSGQIDIVPNAEAAIPGPATVFATLTDRACASSAGTNTNGIAFAPSSGGGTIFVGMECSVWKIPYVTGDRTASSAVSFLNVRTGAPPAGSDGDVHHTTSLVATANALYISVGSSCNACTETDSTRGVILKTALTAAAPTTVATRVRNALALAVNPASGTVWAGGAGQDCVVGSQCFAAQDPTYAMNGHPYEWLDPVTTHAAPADYEWPWCEENGQSVPTPDGTGMTGADAGVEPSGTNCATMIVAPVRAPAYATIMGAVFYAPPNGATYAFPGAYQGGLFFTLHGSWHEGSNGIPVAVPEVVFVPMNAAADTPVYPMDWSNGGSPYATWARNAGGNPAPFMNGFQQQGTRSGRPVGLAVGPLGSLFISDDTSGVIYRIRPGTAPQSVKRAPAATGSRSR